MSKLDAEKYTKAAKLIANGEHSVCCLALREVGGGCQRLLLRITYRSPSNQ